MTTYHSDNSLIPIVINIARDPDGCERFRVASSFEDIAHKPSSGKEMVEIQENYAKLVRLCLRLVKNIRSSRKSQADPLLKWDIAKAMVDFVESVGEKGYYITTATETLARDVNISRSQIGYLFELFKTFPSKEQLYKQISWDKYKEILDIKSRKQQQDCIRKILNGELRTREDIRKFKKSV
jgi:hypothetical protein